MALFENYSTTVNNAAGMYSPYSTGITFTTESAHSITSIQFLLYREGTPASNLSWRLYSTSAGLPTGTALQTGSISVSSVTTDTGGEWFDIPITETSLANGTMYAFVMTCGADTNNTVNANGQYPTSGYTGGTIINGDNTLGAATFSIQNEGDIFFKVYGNSAGGTTTPVSTLAYMGAG